MTLVKTSLEHCPHCGTVTPHKVVSEDGKAPLLWCDVCRRVTIMGHELSLPVDPLPFAPQLRVRIAELDDDHEAIFLILNALHATAKHADRAAMAVETGRLFDDLDRHFVREEELLRTWDYPDLEDHRRQHRRLAEDVRDLVARMLTASPEALPDLVLAIKFSLVEHLGEDLKYKDHLAGAMDR